MDEAYSSCYVEQIRNAHIGLAKEGLICGSISFGYAQVPEGSKTTKRGAPANKAVIDPVQADWVLQIFRWFVEDLLSIQEIARRLNEMEAPLPARASLGYWCERLVHAVLENARYRGLWEYGVEVDLQR
jgi:hypothetical protein